MLLIGIAINGEYIGGVWQFFFTWKIRPYSKHDFENTMKKLNLFNAVKKKN